VAYAAGMVSRVLVVEDDPATARSFAFAIGAVQHLSLVATVHSVQEAIRFLNAQPVDVCLVDLGLPDGSGLQVIRHASQHVPPVRALVVTVFGDESNVIAAIEAGASGYVLKDSLTSSVASEIETLLAGGSPLSPMVAKLLLGKFRESQPIAVPAAEQVKLTKRESEVLNLIARGCSYTEVSSALGVSNETVATHLGNIYSKLSVHSRSEAVYEANRLGLIRF
jgi:DNA-binding NarL/FixJ family response regulator